MGLRSGLNDRQIKRIAGILPLRTAEEINIADEGPSAVSVEPVVESTNLAGIAEQLNTQVLELLQLSNFDKGSVYIRASYIEHWTDLRGSILQTLSELKQISGL